MICYNDSEEMPIVLVTMFYHQEISRLDLLAFYRKTFQVRVAILMSKSMAEPLDDNTVKKGPGSSKGLVKLWTSCLFLVLLGIHLGSKADQNPHAT